MTSAHLRTSSNTTLIEYLIPILFFFSGSAGLILEIVWTKRMILLFGMTAAGVATVLSAFMAGLALGSYLFGRVGSHIKNGLRWYGFLEMGVALSAFVLPILFSVSERIFIAVASQSAANPFIDNMLRFILSFIVLLIPTTFMGGTLPMLSSWYIKSYSHIGKKVSTLYGVNTLGAVVGTLLAGFILIEKVGSWGSTLIACGLLVIIGMVAQGLSSLQSRRIDALDAESNHPSLGTLDGREKLVFLCAGLSGLSALALEVFWTRLLVLAMGTSTYAFTTILATFLIGIAGGSFLIGRFFGKKRNYLLWFATFQLIIGFATIIIFPFFEFLPIIVQQAYFLHHNNWFLFTLFSFIISFLIMLIPTLCMGASFPVAVRLIGAREGHHSQVIGNMYSVNTVGSIFGSFIAGFVLLPLVGIERGIFITIAANFLAAILLLLSAPKVRLKEIGLVFLIITFFVSSVTLRKEWDPLLSKGRLIGHLNRPSLPTKSGVGRVNERELEALYHAEGMVSTVMVVNDLAAEIKALKIDGKTVASSSYHDMRVQKMLGHLPALLCPAPKKALVIGLGTGMTFGALSLYHEIDTRCIELEEKVIPGAALFRNYNNEVIQRLGKTKITIDDGRNYILKMGDKVDIITMDPIHPWVSGASSLFSIDHFKVCLKRLTAKGIMCLWAPLYQLGEREYRCLIKSFATVFPHVQLWFTNTDMILVGSKERITIDQKRFEYCLSNESIRHDLKRVAFDSIPLLLNAYWTDERKLVPYVKDAPTNSDDLPILEYEAPRYRFKSTIPHNISSLLQIRDAQIPLSARLTDKVRNNTNLLRSGDVEGIKGKILYFSSHDSEAHSIFEQMLHKQPENRDYAYFLKETANYLGKAYAAWGKYNQAEKFFKEAIDLFPDDLESHFNLSVIFNRQGKFLEELKENQWVINRQPRLRQGRIALINSMLRLGNYPLAVYHYRILQKLYPGSITPLLKKSMEKLIRRVSNEEYSNVMNLLN